MEYRHSNRSIFSDVSAGYVSGSEESGGFFHYHFREGDSFRRRREFVDATYDDRLRHRLVEVLEEQAKAFGSSRLSIESLRRLGGKGSYTVVTGQQAGIFLGPLYTIYKAVTAIKLSRIKSRELGVPVVPVFWIASEDHDFEEVRSATFYSSERLITRRVRKDRCDSHFRRCEYANKTLHRRERVSRIHTSESALSLIPEIRYGLYSLYPRETVDSIMDNLFESVLRSGECMSHSDYFAKVLAKVFSDTELVIFDPCHAGIRELERDFFRQALSMSEGIVESVRKMQAAKRSAGFRSQIGLSDDSTCMFIDMFGERLALRRTESGFIVNGSVESAHMSNDELEYLIESRPEDLSTGVVLRPVVQDVIFPNLSYIAGPGEINYFAELKGVFEMFGMRMPIVYPRENFTLEDKHVQKLCHKTGVDVETIMESDRQSFIDERLKAESPVDYSSLMDGFARAFHEDYGRLIDELSEIDDDMRQIAGVNSMKIDFQLEYLRGKAKRFNRKRSRRLASELELQFDLIAPYGGLQERTACPINALVETDGRLVSMLLENEDISSVHMIVKL